MPSSSTAIERSRQIEQICLRLLARREHSQLELLNKLALRGYTRQEALPVIAKISAENWQNDQRYAECYARQRLEKGYGPSRIRFELQQRGIAAQDLDELVAEQYGDWQNLLLAVYRSKYDDNTALTHNEWFKRCRFLQQRGFSAELIKGLQLELQIKLGR
ncbi:regulatory protein RecX [Methylomonas paludis]|uniref:Regulatory protein RecX n=1 Tax=Methylomonas paludis TaxID=1173101 RepID=A0A975MLE7_9GAMM|nr:regulatory protein RecX [Methylomonas paludis]QWF69957.1 regulatory protein RecX [Methylomonas paludis]